MVAGRDRQVVVLYSNDYMGIYLGGPVLKRSSYRGGHLNRFDCSAVMTAMSWKSSVS